MKKVHRGQETESLALDSRGFCVPSGGKRCVPFDVIGFVVFSRLDAAEIAAFNTVVNGGFMPQAKQGGKSLDGVAVVGSKLDATGLENEHIGQIQVAFTGFGDGLVLGEAADCR